MQQRPARPSTFGMNEISGSGVTPMRRVAILAAGYLSLGMGLIGIIVPLWPTTCFILLSAWCFSRSSPAMHRWLHDNRVFGAHLRLYRDHGVIALRVRNASLLTLWSAIGLSGVMVAHMVWLQLLLLGVGAAITLHLVRMPTVPSPAPAGPGLEAGAPPRAWLRREVPR